MALMRRGAVGRAMGGSLGRLASSPGGSFLTKQTHKVYSIKLKYSPSINHIRTRVVLRFPKLDLLLFVAL